MSGKKKVHLTGFIAVWKDEFKKNYQLYLLVVLPLVYFLIFKYLPMYGLQIAFRRYSPVQGVLGSPWVGLKNFITFFNSYKFDTVLVNTVLMSFMTLIFSFPLPIILALLLNSARNYRLKKSVQLITYMPHFISTVVVVGMIFQFLAPRLGMVNKMIVVLGGEEINFMGRPGWFRPIYILSGIWQNTGWSAIIYLAALANIDASLHEAASIDGASRIQRIFAIELPSLMPTIVILLILNTGRIMNIGFEKAFLMQTPLNLSTSEIISTYVYKTGLQNSIPNFSYAAAIGFFNSVVNLTLIVSVNKIARKLGNSGLW